MTSPQPHPALIVLAGPTASGKSALALFLAERLHGEVLSCDSVAIYRGMDIGSAKPSLAARARIPHHGLDLLDPDQPSTAGDYARAARATLTDIRDRGKLPIIAGGTGLYLRALLDGLAPAPARNDALRENLRKRANLHRLLQRFDPHAAAKIHPNDTPKLIRSLEVTLLARQPQTEQWQTGRDPLTGFRIFQLGLNPPRAELYARINDRAAAMFSTGLLVETAAIQSRFGNTARGLTSLGYAQALSVLENKMTLSQAIAEAQQGHRNYAKRQLTWFRRDPRVHWLPSFGDDPSTQAEALRLLEQHLKAPEGREA